MLGLITIITPINPNKTAHHLFKPTFSFKKKNAKIVTKNGDWTDVDNLESLPGLDSDTFDPDTDNLPSIWSLDFGKFEGNDILWLLTSNGVQGYSISGTRINPINQEDLFLQYQVPRFLS